tara:strand:- start:53 stop:178 length:126 start_codon:yes stop_codon:yes gene_type:complete
MTKQIIKSLIIDINIYNSNSTPNVGKIGNILILVTSDGLFR